MNVHIDYIRHFGGLELGRILNLHSSPLLRLLRDFTLSWTSDDIFAAPCPPAPRLMRKMRPWWKGRENTWRDGGRFCEDFTISHCQFVLFLLSVLCQRFETNCRWDNSGSQSRKELTLLAIFGYFRWIQGFHEYSIGLDIWITLI